jgi:hypothetical protein
LQGDVLTAAQEKGRGEPARALGERVGQSIVPDVQFPDRDRAIGVLEEKGKCLVQGRPLRLEKGPTRSFLLGRQVIACPAVYVMPSRASMCSAAKV